MDAVERVERRLIALEQLFHSESKMFADQDGMWTIPMLRSEVLSLARSNGGIGALREIVAMIENAREYGTLVPLIRHRAKLAISNLDRLTGSEDDYCGIVVVDDEGEKS